MHIPYYKVRMLTESKKPTGRSTGITITEWNFKDYEKARIQYEYLIKAFIGMKIVGSIELNRVESAARSCVYMNTDKRFTQK